MLAGYSSLFIAKLSIPGVSGFNFETTDRRGSGCIVQAVEYTYVPGGRGFDGGVKYQGQGVSMKREWSGTSEQAREVSALHLHFCTCILLKRDIL
ncbi:hypothetical protein DFH27DRAFT_136124 [Peziza echinospora]|nr:hypothetical protein DFH27DRAFT_136124 [Peziza echinospora]